MVEYDHIKMSPRWPERPKKLHWFAAGPAIILGRMVNLSHRACGRRAGAAALGSLVSLACVHGALPVHDEARAQAIGTVHVSTPLFTPLDPFRQDRALDFKELRDERYLNDRINQANMSVSTLATRQVEAGAAVAVARKARSPAAAAATAEPPSAPAVDGTSTLAGEAQQTITGFLGRSDARHLLTPDEVATIVASLKLYMVSLEDYYNAVAIYNDALRSNPSWVPYRVHFTITTDPGWFTGLNGYDAIAEVSIGNPDEVQVLTVIPPQNTQAFEQFSATFHSLASTLTAEVRTNRVATRAAVRALHTAAARLEGLRANTTFTASALGGNKVRLRFRPSIVPGKGQLELQPLSRIVTAVVLVRPEAASGGAGTDCPADDGRGGASTPTSWFSRGIRAATTPAGTCLASGQIEVTHAAWFEAGPAFQAGSRRPPRMPSAQRTLCNNADDPASCRTKLATVAGYLPRWTPTAVFGAAALVVDEGMFWPGSRAGAMVAAVPFDLRVPAPEEGFMLNVDGPGVVRCAQTWAGLEQPDLEHCQGSCEPSSHTSFVVHNPRASVFVCALDGQVLGAAESVPIYVTASSNSVSLRGKGVDFSSVVAKAVLRRVALQPPVDAPAPAPAPTDVRAGPAGR